MKKIYENKIIIILISFIILLIIFLLSFINDKKSKEEEITLDTITQIKETTTKENEKFYVDVKGSVNNPGVYEFKENDRVIDAIELAGGLSKYANTSNINLSQKLTSEMVIYVYSNSEIKNNNTLSCDTICKPAIMEVNNCISNNQTSNTKININTATIEDLTKLSGIGESKAKTIIEYRESNGNFKSIDELKNISGIGESLYEKIKNNITI